MEYFTLWYRFSAEDRYSIWTSDGDNKDSMVVDDDGFIPTFTDVEILRRYVDLNRRNLQSEEPKLFDLDQIAAWTRSPNVHIDCKEALDAWNLFGDVANSLGDRGNEFKRLDTQFGKDGPFDAEPTPSIYNKLFWGSNLPSVTPEGCEYVPEWSIDEVASLTELLATGLDLFTSNTRNWPPEP